MDTAICGIISNVILAPNMELTGFVLQYLNVRFDCNVLKKTLSFLNIISSNVISFLRHVLLLPKWS